MRIGTSMLHRMERALHVIQEDRFGMSLRQRLQLGRMPRYTASTVSFLGKPLEIVDAASFLAGVDEIFRQRCYEFPSSSRSPYIIDCGANIGLSCIFFTTLYPAAKIVAFEPDPTIFAALAKNTWSFGISEIELHKQAVWTCATTLEFIAEGAHGGRLAMEKEDGKRIKVETVRLRDFLTHKVDLLKIDIEGAETEVLRDCVDALGCVERVFIEYHSRAGEPQTLQEILSLLLGCGFRYHLKDALSAPSPFHEHSLSHGMDFQTNLYAFRDSL